MWEYIRFSLDMATALSVIVAVLVFAQQQRSERRSERNDAKRALVRELATKIVEIKADIVNHVTHVNPGIRDSDRATEERYTLAGSMMVFAMNSLAKANDYVAHDLQLTGSIIGRQYDDLGLEERINKLASVFFEDIFEVYSRLISLRDVSEGVHVWQFYWEFLLGDIGITRIELQPGAWVVLAPTPMGEPLDEEGREIVNRGYTPRRYIKKEEQPPTLFCVLDKLANALASER